MVANTRIGGKIISDISRKERGRPIEWRQRLDWEDCCIKDIKNLKHNSPNPNDYTTLKRRIDVRKRDKEGPRRTKRGNMQTEVVTRV